MKRFSVHLLLMTIIVAAAGYPPLAAQNRDSIRVGSMMRYYYVHLPAGYAQGSGALPLVLGFHGAGQKPTDGLISFSRMTGLNEKADSENFIAVYPEGTAGPNGDGNLTWNGGGCCAPASFRDIDDIGFITLLLDTLEARYRIDSRRVYATGISNGGIFSYRLACELADRITAIAPVEAAYMVEGRCTPARPVPVLHIHSWLDSIIPYNGGSGVLSPAFPFPSVDSTIRAWRAAIGCTDEADTIGSSSLYVARRWSLCAGDAVVELYATSDGGHSWPGTLFASQAFDATDLIWEFFSRHTIEGPSSAESPRRAGSARFLLAPNPSVETVTATVVLARREHIRIEIFDTGGELVALPVDTDLEAGEHLLRLPALPAGAYLVRGTGGDGTVTEMLIRR